LAKGLKVNQSLLRISMTHNAIGDKGAMYLAKALEFNRTLQKMNLSSNSFEHDGAKNLAKTLKNEHVNSRN
jgi:Ran GTPase-activating protein (RanGAP) involved in mRNA processing and transport